MNKNLVIGLASVVVVGGAILVGNMSGNKEGGSKNKIESSCSSICQKANKTCPSLIDENNCNKNCSKLSEEAKKHLEESKNCEQITSKPELIADLLIPEIATPEQKGNVSGDDCQMACMNYAIKCLTLVPNATDELLDEGRESCMKECKEWNNEKIDCMINAINCEAFTNVCGL